MSIALIALKLFLGLGFTIVAHLEHHLAALHAFFRHTAGSQHLDRRVPARHSCRSLWLIPTVVLALIGVTIYLHSQSN
jgi:hypothetical protein